MSANGWLQFAIYSLILLASVRPVGIYLARVLEGERTWLDPVLRPIERLIYRLSGVNAAEEKNWRENAFAVLGFYARGHHELSHPDGRPRHAQLLVGGGGHRGGRSLDPGHQAHHLRHHRQLLGGYDPHVALRAGAGIADLCAAARRPGRSAEPP